MRQAWWVTPDGSAPPVDVQQALDAVGWGLVPARSIDVGDVQPGLIPVPEPQALDALTELPNRSAFGRHFPDWMERHGADPVAVLVVLDLDWFKQVNDQFGHGLGDQVLRAVAQALRTGLTARDLAARLGGDEFVLALSRSSAAVLRHDLDELRQRVQGLRFQAAPGLAVTASAGVTDIRPDDGLDTLVARADAALYRAKASGRDAVVFDEGGASLELEHETELQRFMDITQVYSERLTQVVHTLSRRLVQGARRDALQDRLTGVHNRRYFDERLAREWAVAVRDERPLSLLFLDLDDFGAINRRHGYACGDAVLQRFAQLASDSIRLVDWLARWGGEEFCVVMPDTGAADALAVAERLRAAVAAGDFHTPAGDRLGLSCSVGVASRRAGLDTVDALADAASRAARRAKAAGKNRVVADAP